MGKAELAAAVERLMGQVDYYLHCELDEEYDHERPDSARRQLEMCIEQELSRASALGLISAVARPVVAAGSDDLAG